MQIASMRTTKFVVAGLLSCSSALKPNVQNGAVHKEASNEISSIGGVAAKVRAVTAAKNSNQSASIVENNSTMAVNLRAEQKQEVDIAAKVSKVARKAEEGCGLLKSFPNAKPKDYRDGRKTKYDKDKKKSVDNVFKSGDVVKFECLPGFTTDGANDGDTIFDVECLDEGYYEPKGVCSKASKCGALPEIPHAAPTGKSNRGKVEFACIKGYSLDGEDVVDGGEQKNSHFELKCVEFKGKYEEFSGKCQPYAFVPATETIRMYNEVFKALFVVSCKGTLKKEFGKCGDKACAPPAGLDTACAKITRDDDAGSKKTECESLVSAIKSDFDAKKSERETFDKEKKRDAKWFEDDINEDRPHLNDEATKFCTDLWGVLKVGR